MMKTTTKVSLVFVPLPLMGHLVATVELAKTLLLHHNRRQLSVTILNIPPAHPSPEMSSYLSSIVADLGDQINLVGLPETDRSSPGTAQDAHPMHLASTLVGLYKPNVKSILQAITVSTPVAAVVVDMSCVGILDVADELGIPCYLFFTSSAAMLGLMLHMPTLDGVLPADKDMGELQEEGTLIHLPGFSSPLPPLSMPNNLMRRKGQKHMWFLRFGLRFREVTGIIVNSYKELQPGKFRALEEGDYLPDHPTPPVYSIGPLLSLSGQRDDGKRHECLQWLDQQPPGSVVFLCFGTKGSFSTEQVTELAIGLERSGHPFLWVIHGPPSKHAQRKLMQPTHVLDEAPLKGFIERTRNRGMVWPEFAPQAAVLSHKALGGFVTHCGWNSVMESLWFGVPMLAWPLYAEQHLNAFEMITEMGVAVELKIDRKTENWATAVEIERGVKCLMGSISIEVSKKVRSKVIELSEKGRRAVMGGGSSFLSMQKLVEVLVSNVSTPQSYEH